MGTYTTNYNLFLPTIGEQGWGDLVNGNFTAIDTTMKSLSNSIGTLETETDTFDDRITALEKNVDSNGNLNADTATSLNKSVTVTPSTTRCTMSIGTTMVCPYTPGVLYTGSLTVTGGSYYNTTHGLKIALSDGTFQIEEYNNKKITTTINFTNAVYVVVYESGPANDYIQYTLPIFS